jgi:hypothetical protein
MSTYLRAHNTTIKFGAGDVIEDATVVGIPGDEYDLIEKPSLTDTRKDHDLSDTPDSPEITVTVPLGTTIPAPGTLVNGIIITLTKADRTVTFNGIVRYRQPGNAEVAGLLSEEVTIKPTSGAVIAPIGGG